MSDRDIEIHNRIVEMKAQFLNITAALVTLIGFFVIPFSIVFGRDLLPIQNWLIVAAVLTLFGIGLHLLARMILKGLR